MLELLRLLIIVKILRSISSTFWLTQLPLRTISVQSSMICIMYLSISTR
jgi:hypothetical protein